MHIREELEKLIKLQEFDLRVQRARKNLVKINVHVKPLEEALAKIDVKLAEQEILKKDFEKKILDRINANASDKIYADGMESKLGSISAHKEYHYTAKTIDKLRKLGRDRSAEIESFQKHLADIQSFINEKQAEKNDLFNQLQNTLSEIQSVTKETEKEIEDAQVARELFRPNVSPGILFKYEKLMGAYGHGIGMVKDRRCQSCDVMLPPQTFNLLQRSEEVLQCPNCQRLLCLSPHQ